MRVASILRVVVLALVPAVYATAQTCTVKGILVATDGTPVRHGHVEASWIDGGSSLGSPSAETDEAGHFSLTLQSAGLWKLTATARGFQSSALDAHGDYFTAVALSPSSPVADVLFRLAPDAILTGYVQDEAGEAVRNAQVTLLGRSKDLEDAASAWRRLATTRADDRGYYEFPGLAPGAYQVAVQAQPWYASGAQRRMGAPTGTGATPPVESPLDVSYPLTWYPGVTDPASAGTVTLEAGGTARADLRLLPVPSIHLRLPASPGAIPNQPTLGPFPQIQLVWPDGSFSFQPPRPVFSPSGEMDIGGLAPGTYRITNLRGSEQPFLLHIASGSPRTVDANNAMATHRVAIHFDLPQGSEQPEVHFTDTATGQVFVVGEDHGGAPLRLRPQALQENPGQRSPGFRRSPRGREDPTREDRIEDRTIDLPPGRYEVRVNSARHQFLTSLSATGAQVSGHVVTIPDASCDLTLHIMVGSATVTGTVTTVAATPARGAMLLLVPATQGDLDFLAKVLRAQSNTDGSFRLIDVPPGQYILVAIDHGWPIDWRDPATLARYLIHGVPVDLTARTTTRESLQAQSP